VADPKLKGPIIQCTTWKLLRVRRAIAITRGGVAVARNRQVVLVNSSGDPIDSRFPATAPSVEERIVFMQPRFASGLSASEIATYRKQKNAGRLRSPLHYDLRP
jgi:hypothetical protein